MEDIKPFSLENNIPICFSSSDNYSPILSVAIKSIINSSNQKNNYDIIILEKQISDENKSKISSLAKNKNNVSIRFVNVSPYVDSYKFETERAKYRTEVTEEMYYRVLVPALLSKYKNAIFCDADIVCVDDIAKILETNIENHMLGAVRDYDGIASCYNNNYERARYRFNDLQIKNFFDYFSSAIMVFNIPKFREKYTARDLLDLTTAKKWSQYDQDFFNVLCKDDVKLLDSGWNFLEDINNSYQKLPENIFKEYLKSEDNPKIIHYSDKRKPWILTESKYNPIFWEIAKSTPFFEELQEKLVSNFDYSL